MMSSEPAELRLPARLENLSRFLEFAVDQARKLGLEERIPALELGLEEALVNVIRYAAREGEEITLAATPEADGIGFTISDRGAPFNPLEAPPPDLESELLERPIGGLGIHFMKELTDEISWSREGDRNRLRLFFRGQHD